MTPDLLEGLNPEQRQAVEHGRGPLLVLAGAGSGKTRVVTRRLARLIQKGADPARIVAVTFTNKAAGEMRDRVRALLGGVRVPGFVGTFHAWGLRFLRRRTAAAGLSPNFAIADSGDQLSLVRDAMEELGIPESMMTPSSVHARISEAKGALRSAASFAEMETDFSGSRVARVYELYEKKLRAANAVDFDDLIALPAKVLASDAAMRDAEHARVQHLLVDEYQDTNSAQDALVRHLGETAESLCAVGDEDQSIYRWRGAQVEHILRFEDDYPGSTVVALTRNYRSTQKILHAAAGVVSRNRRRREKKLVSEAGAGEPVSVHSFADDRGEAQWIVSRIGLRLRPFSDCAVLFRVNAQSRAFEDELVRREIPYVVIGGMKFYERAEVKDAVAYFRLALDPNDDLAFRRVVNVPARGIGAATLEKIFAFARGHGVSLFDASEKAADITERAKIALGRFREIIRSAGQRAADASPAELLDFVLEASGYRALYAASMEREDVARRENLTELLSAASEYELREENGASPRGFLDVVALATDADAVKAEGAVSLMTLHSAKGLEFSEVFVAGLEEGFLPHTQSSESDEEIEEERRLLYVGMTRAKESLTLTLARQRMLYGETRRRDPSRFLDDLPAESVERIDEAPIFAAALSAGAEDENQELESESWQNRRAGRPLSVARRRAVLPDTVPGLGRGQRVRHPKYGLGVVLQQEGSGDDARLTVYFDRAGKKKFVAKFANLAPA